MDLTLLRELADLRPDLHLVLIGPVVKIAATSLPRSPNIHWLGPKSYAELPSYVAGWDVAMMPFARNNATRYISPTKTLEYLAAAKPVVSTSIRDVVSPYGDAGLVRIADTADAFARGIDDALTERGDGASRDAFLSSTSWDITFSRMRALVEEAAARRARPRDREESPCSTI
jgi:UDP-galactopyranose mutase